MSCEPSKVDAKSIVRHDSPNNGSGIERTEFQSSVNNENSQTSKRKCMKSIVAKPGNVVPISKILIPLSCEPSKVDSKSIVRHDSPNNASGIERNLGKGKLSSHQEVVSNDVLPPLKKKKSDLKIYCHCRISNEMHNKKINSQDFVGCDMKSNCTSLYKRLEENKVLGGDWFHQKCVKLERLPDKDKDEYWYCSTLCKQSACLKNEFREIVPVKPDGNCLYRALALCKYNNADSHTKIREEICDKLINLAQCETYKDRWNLEFWKSDQAENLIKTNSDAYLIYSLVKIFHLDFVDPKFEKRTITEHLKAYAERKRSIVTKADSSDEKLFKYGANIELLVFACSNELNVWIFQNNSEDVFSWHFAASNLFRNFEQNLAQRKYVTLYFRRDKLSQINNHYNFIKNKSSAKIPSTRYSYILQGDKDFDKCVTIYTNV